MGERLGGVYNYQANADGLKQRICPRCVNFKNYLKNRKVKLPEKYFIYAQINNMTDKKNSGYLSKYFIANGRIEFPYIHIMDSDGNILGHMSGEGSPKQYNKFISDSFKKGVELSLTEKNDSPFSSGLTNISAYKPVKNMEIAIKQAKTQNKLLLINGVRKDATRCGVFRRYVKFNKVKLPKKYFLYHEIDITDRGKIQAFANRFRVSGSLSPPYMYVVDPDAKHLGTLNGGRSVPEYNRFISDVYRKWKK